MKIKQAAKKSKNNESLQVIGKKFLRQYNEVLSNIEANEEDWDMTMRITFQHSGSILTTMGFLQETVTEGKPDY